MPEAVFLVDLEADRETVRDALTSESGIRSWWTSDANVSGDGLDLGFPEAPARFSLSVSEATDERVVWTSDGEFPPHWVGTTVTWHLGEHPSGTGTQLFFVHDGFGAVDPMLGHTSYTWAQLMGHLQRYVDGSEVDPFFG